MNNRLEDLWKSANDGASAPIGPPGIRTETEVDDLLHAWYAERSNCIECGILLEQSKELIRRLLIESAAGPSRRRQARRLIRAIDRALQVVEPREI